MLRSASRSTLSSSSSWPQSSNGRPAHHRNSIQNAVCVPTTHINESIAWVVNAGNAQVTIDRVVQDSVAFIHHPLNTRSKTIGNALPLYLNARHFSAAFPLLQDHVRTILTPTQSDLAAHGRQAARHRMPTAAVRQAMVTEYFPQLVRNMSTQLALSAASARSINDLEIFAQVHLVWRATIQRIGHDAQDWIAAKIQQHALHLSLGGSLARQVPLLELVTLLHVNANNSKYSWATLAHRIVEENTIRLFQYMDYVRRCANCAQVLVGDDRPAATAAIQFAGELEARKLDGKRYVHWSVLRMHVQFLGALRSVPQLKSGGFDLHKAGGHYRNEVLEPGRLASEMYERLAGAGAMNSWENVLEGMGAAPMQEEVLGRWLRWCAEQGKCVHRSMHKCTTCEAIKTEGEWYLV